ncbi:MAG: DNA polymerase III subunit gamma/tau [Thermoflexales bacterium]|nr:DNA polymerase III subunit gamma/tau [Thermoflexales bacterium]MDW8351809.1 DNA polymerase III subunit gamma/tau [Anaerolineae bacterium]
MAEALYRKWRPKSFDEVVGQEHIITTLKNQVATGRIGHAYLFVGSRGCGKTTSARILAKEVNIAGLDPDSPRAKQIAEAIAEGRALDVIEIDAASHTSVDDIREIRDRVGFQPSELRYKVYIIDEVHMLSTAAFNALLKTLEEPPPHVIFILATTDPQKIPATVLSRCQRFNFRRVPVDKIVARLRQLCEAEGIEADDHALRLIARHAAGSLRDAVSLLDQLASSSSMRISAADVREALGATDATTVRALVNGLIARDLAAGFDAIQNALDQGADARQIARQVVEHLRALLQMKAIRTPQQANTRIGGLEELSEAERIELAAQSEKLSVAQLTRAVRAFSEAINEMRNATDAQLPLEMAYLDCIVEPEQSPAPAQTQPSVAQPRKNAPPETSSAEPTPTAAASPASTPPAPPSQTVGQLTCETLKAQWQQFIREVNTVNKPAAALLRSCDPYAVTGNVVYLHAHHEIPLVRLREPKNKTSVVATLNRMFNGSYDIHVSLRQHPADLDPEEDPVVKAAQQLGGTVRQ